MSRARIATGSTEGCYFLTFTVSRWYYLFDRHDRWPLLARALEFERARKAITLYGFVFMLNHLHLIVGAADTAGFVRNFKRQTAKDLKRNLRETEPTVLDLFRTEDGYVFWKPDNAPKRIESEAFFLQKLTYIHDNPVRKTYVSRPEHWRWSSACPDCPLQPDPFW
ncbi:MAG TPA: hypothetical protein VD978_34875 [Azospirillum sp.]|nr:hypothetical protein [Azospirillum sp.]